MLDFLAHSCIMASLNNKTKREKMFTDEELELIYEALSEYQDNEEVQEQVFDLIDKIYNISTQNNA